MTCSKQYDLSCIAVVDLRRFTLFYVTLRVCPDIGSRVRIAATREPEFAALRGSGIGTQPKVGQSARAGPQLEGKRSLGCCFVCAGETGKE